MTKQELFLWGVQTIVLSNNTNVIRQDPNGKLAHIYSATGVFSVVQDAIYASERIPAELSVTEAINQFCFYMLENLREDLECPQWFRRY
ncbi:hypothetical protein RA241_000773 [Cronobacter sakazakii]|uniref:hypothetical protein n=1 Tax=Cronobacter turicensis TaxID=413502 RepID=UPI000D01374B|nr:hypothetical protein [Cronobacter turicensis]EKC7002260.1 hypothetical protein [Cronobacter sakazakii]EKM5753111.1 hypothetical protein [Cronobacter sakazakii]EKY1951543.1 hypothetical protein [Cronobacter sakazakii]EKY1956807.1 hypothetical protein [Cronobacter sakazakii]EKY1959476.1 hypothetical protein [Cronobacter sakazakii]